MNKIIFQVGLLSFCVSVVVFSTFGHGMLEVIARSFIVFVAAIVTMVGILVGASMLTDKDKQESEQHGSAA